MKNENEISDASVAHESTYALLVRSEERERSFFEMVVYGLFILSAVTAIWQFAQQPVTLPANGVIHSASVTHEAKAIRS